MYAKSNKIRITIGIFFGILFICFFQQTFIKASDDNISTFDQAEKYIENNQNTNILIYNSNDQIVAEYHANGESLTYYYDNSNQIKEVKYSNGKKETFTYNYAYGKTELHYNNNLSKTSNIINASQTNPILFSKREYEKTTINKINMNNLISNKQFRNYKSMNTKKLKKFFKKKKSILWYPTKIYKYDKKTNKLVYKRKIDAATYIIKYCKKYKINPKIIVCLLQKEQSLVTAERADYKSRSFTYALGYGATDKGDYKKYEGFDKQLLYATKRLNTLYKKSPKSYPQVINNINYNKTKKNVYKNYIWVDNKATYVLYQYTPHTIDAKIYDETKEKAGGNYLFKRVSQNLFNGKWN